MNKKNKKGILLVSACITSLVVFLGAFVFNITPTSSVVHANYELKKEVKSDEVIVVRDWNKIKIKKLERDDMGELKPKEEFPIYFSVADVNSSLGTKDNEFKFKEGKIIDENNKIDANNIVKIYGLKFTYEDGYIVLNIPKDKEEANVKSVYLGLEHHAKLHGDIGNNGAWVDMDVVRKQMEDKGDTFGKLKKDKSNYEKVKERLHDLTKGIKGQSLAEDKKNDEDENSETQPQKEVEKQQPSPKPAPNEKPAEKTAPKAQPFVSLKKPENGLVLEGRTVDGDIRVRLDNKSAELVKAKEISLKEYGFNATAKFDPRNYQVFDINLLDKDGKKISEYPEGFEAEVNFPVVEGREPIGVKYFPNKNDSSKQITIPSKEVEIGGRKYIQFKVSHFSVYGVEYKPVSNGKDKLPNTGASTGTATGLVMLIGLGIAFFTKKR